MRTIDTSHMTFLHRNLFSCGNAKGVVASVPVTVWRDRGGEIHYVPDDPAQLPVLEKMLWKEMPNA